MFKSRYITNFLSLASGNVVSQLILFGSLPFLTRLYSPEAFGVFALFSALSFLVGMMSALAYQRGLLLVKGDDAVQTLFVFITIVIVFSSFLAFGLIHIFGFGLTGSVWRFLFPVSIAVVGLQNALRLYSLQKQAFRWLSFSRISEVVISESVKIACALYFAPKFEYLAIAFVVGGGVSIVVMFLSVNSVGLMRSFSDFNISKGLVLAKELKNLPLYSAPSIGLNIMSQHCVVFLFSNLYSSAVVGFYGLSNRALQQPVVMITRSAGDLFFQKASTIVHEKRRLSAFLRKNIIMLGVIGVLPFAVATCWGDILFTFVFGAEWEMAGVFAQILSPSIFMIFISNALLSTYEVLMQQRARLVLNSLSLACKVAAILIAYSMGASSLSSIKIFSATVFFTELVTILYSLAVAKKYDKRLLGLCT